jgi:hypothetical protein
MRTEKRERRPGRFSERNTSMANSPMRLDPEALVCFLRGAIRDETHWIIVSDDDRRAPEEFQQVVRRLREEGLPQESIRTAAFTAELPDGRKCPAYFLLVSAAAAQFLWFTQRYGPAPQTVVYSDGAREMAERMFFDAVGKSGPIGLDPN